MSLTLDSATLAIDEWDTEVSMVDDWLGAIWGVHPGASSPRSSIEQVPPACQAAAVWLATLWGFSV